MPTLWIHGGKIPTCPCGASSADQVRCYGGGAPVHWFCRICVSLRAPPADWVDELVPIGEPDLKARNAAMAARVLERWRTREDDR